MTRQHGRWWHRFRCHLCKLHRAEKRAAARNARQFQDWRDTSANGNGGRR